MKSFAVEIVDARYCQVDGKACILHFDPCCREYYCDGFFTGKCVKSKCIFKGFNGTGWPNGLRVQSLFIFIIKELFENMSIS